MQWLDDLQESQAFRKLIGAADPADSGPLAKHAAAARSREAAEMREEAQRREQAEAAHGERLMRMLADEGVSSFEELYALRSARQAAADRRAEREEEAARAERADRAQERVAEMWAAGRRPRTVQEILQAAAMFP